MEIGGTALYEDGEAIRGANVLLLRGHAKDGSGVLPSFVPFARSVTDANGRYKFEVERREAIIVELIRDRCDWFGSRRSIEDGELKEKALNIDIIAKRDRCDEKNR